MISHCFPTLFFGQILLELAYLAISPQKPVFLFSCRLDVVSASYVLLCFFPLEQHAFCGCVKKDEACVSFSGIHMQGLW